MSDFRRPDREADLEVEVTLLPTNEGGRKQPLWQGCRLPHDFGLPGEMNDGMYEFIGAPPHPGESQKASVWLMAPERNRGRIRDGYEYGLWEGRFIGKAKVIRVINPMLRSDDE